MKAIAERIIKFIFVAIIAIGMVAPRPVLAQDVTPTQEPAATEIVTEVPTEAATDAPTEAPTEVATDLPTEIVTEAATDMPTEAPTEAATEAPTEVLTEAASEEPTAAPTEVEPTEVPTDEELVAEVVELLASEDAVLLDEEGNPLSMASQETAEVIVNSDPFFWDGTKWVGYTEDTCPDFVASENCHVVAANTAFASALAVVPENSTLYVAGGSTYETAKPYAEDVVITTANLSFVGYSALATGAGSTNTIDPSLITPGFAVLQQIILKANFGTTLGVFADNVIVWNDLDGVGPNQDGYLNDALNLVNIGNPEATIEADLLLYQADGYMRVADANDPSTNFELECGEPGEEINYETYHVTLKNPNSSDVIQYYGSNATTEIANLLDGASMSEQLTLSFMEPDYQCPSGTTKVGNVCEKKATCSSGWYYDDGDKLCHEDSDEFDYYICQGGGWYANWDGKCHYSRGSYTPDPCLEGYTLDQYYGTCEKIPAAPKDGNCSSGMVLNPVTHKCELDTVPTCPTGTTLNSTTKKCDLPAWSHENEKYEFWKLLGKSNGSTDLTTPIYNYINGSAPITRDQVVWFLWPTGKLGNNAKYPTCKQDETQDANGNCIKIATPTCDQGWEYYSSDKLCHQKPVIIKVNPTCPVNYHFNYYGTKCYPDYGYGWTWPTTCDTANGYNYDSDLDKCVKTQTPAAPKDGNCSSGMVLNPVTHKCEKNNGFPQCPNGTVLSTTNGKCEAPKSPDNTQLTFLKYACPKGQTLINGVCATPCSYDPSIAASSASCKPCSYDPSMAASSASCKPCSYDPSMAASSASCKPCSYDPSIAASSASCKPCSYDPSIAASSASCKPCSYDPSIAASSASCKPCSYDPSMAASNTNCKPCSYDPSMAASNTNCTPCVFDPTISATDSKCPAPCIFNPDIASTDSECPAPCVYNPAIPATDTACVPPAPPVIPVTGATPVLGIPVTGGVGGLIPVTGGTLIVSGLGHSCMSYNGQIVCWGLNDSGQLGDGTNNNQTKAVYVKGITNVLNLTAGSKHTCALTIDGEVMCWGENGSGQLGNGSTTDSSEPVKVSGLPAKVLNFTAGEEFTCAELANQEVWCWGKNSAGQLNDGSTKNQTSPVKTKLTSLFAQFSGGQGFLLGGDVLGSVNTWAKVQATAVKEVTNSLSLSANRWGATGCAVITDGSVKCWGRDFVSNPVAGAVTAIEVGAGSEHNCTINNDQTVSCWGANGNGELGNGLNTASPSATLVKNMQLARVLAVGAHHTCVLAGANNTPMCWGDNTYGQLGNNSTSDSNLPVLVILPE